MAERTLVIIKPDAVMRHLVGEIISRFEQKGLKLVAAKFIKIPEKIARQHYAVHKDKPFFDGVVKYLASGPAFVMVWQADNAIQIVRKMLGATFGYDALPGTIRGDFSCAKGYNLVHGSDSKESADFEIPLYFKAEDSIDYGFPDEDWLYGKND